MLSLSVVPSLVSTTQYYFQNAPLFEGVKISLQNRHFLFLLLDDTKKRRRRRRKEKMPAALPTVTVQNGNGASVALPEVFTSPIRPYVFCLRVRFFASREGVREGFSHASFSSSSSSSGWGFCPCCGRDRTREMGHKADDATAGTRRARSNRVLTEYCLLTFETTTVTSSMPCTPD